MIIKEEVLINGNSFLHIYSDEGKMLLKDGKCYSDVIEAVDSNSEYSETDNIAPITLTLSMIDSPSWSKEDNIIYEIREDGHGNLITKEIYK